MGDQITLTLALAPVDPDGEGMETALPFVNAEDGSQTAVWAEVPSMAANVTVSPDVGYHQASGDGVRNTVRATLVDQYGDPIRRTKIKFTSGLNADDGMTNGGLGDTGLERTTNSSGVATASYTVKRTGRVKEVITALYDHPTDETKDKRDTGDHYWTTTTNASLESVVAVDKDNNTIVTGDANLLTYKAGDQFTVGTTAVTLEAFEKALSVGDEITATLGANGGVSSFTLSDIGGGG